ncbi:MAG TPA: TIGR00180 family glycosyltransferase [Methanocorpusculum sp.]|nr:TIGR00180 family glycosyltransferase [Methanocorpusculum sp.]HJK80414.1 TIGR00180 family glycosyltransferase [Methanocorpusculum sp.]
MMRDMDFVDEYYADKDLSLLKKLTLVIPTYNRNYYLSRCLWYHAHFPFGEIIVADSSPEEKKMVNRETVQKIREKFGANVRYLEYEPETEKYGGDIYRKWGDAVQHVETEYSQFCTDKAFKLPLSLVESIKYLDSNREYIASQSGKFCYYINNNNQHKENHISETINTYKSETNDSGLIRFLNSISNKNGNFSNSLLLCITRTKILKQIYNSMTDYSINDIRYGEIYLAYAGHLLGKYHAEDDDVFSIRDITQITKERKLSPKIKSGESSTTRYPYLSDDEYTSSPEGKRHYQSYKRAIIEDLTKYTDVGKDKATKYIDSKLKYTLLNKYGNFPKSKLLIIIYLNHPKLSILWDRVPDHLKQKIVGRSNNNENYHEITMTPDLMIIQKIIEVTQHLYVNDAPIKTTPTHIY